MAERLQAQCSQIFHVPFTILLLLSLYKSATALFAILWAPVTERRWKVPIIRNNLVRSFACHHYPLSTRAMAAQEALRTRPNCLGHPALRKLQCLVCTLGMGNRPHLIKDDSSMTIPCMWDLSLSHSHVRSTHSSILLCPSLNSVWNGNFDCYDYVKPVQKVYFCILQKESLVNRTIIGMVLNHLGHSQRSLFKIYDVDTLKHIWLFMSNHFCIIKFWKTDVYWILHLWVFPAQCLISTSGVCSLLFSYLFW